MTAELLIHATLTVSGDPVLLPAADARIKTLLVEEIFEGGFEEHDADAALSYDFKVGGGVPFPAFALASQEFPQLAVVAEWVNVAAGRRGRARIADGKIVDHAEEAITTGAAEARNCYFEVEPDGTLRLAFVLVQRGRGEWAGYMLNHERDALFDIRRDGAAIELRATEGAAEWALMWKLDAPDAHPLAQACESPQPLAHEEYAELERLASARWGSQPCLD